MPKGNVTTMKHPCAGCGKDFDLPVTRYKTGKAWGRDKFYCKRECIKVRKTVGGKMQY